METSMENWLSEAQRTVELFSGLPQVQPCLDLGPSSNREIAKSCLKN